ncbi:MAG: alpha/beta fold hydrolase [Actinobacteria bacterium]|nr:alpha/beta fold hydrolase [Actinomycetota bacterium]MCI0542889.1 alpha/beta fold hydrolase [Actinomycetota bacterium]
MSRYRGETGELDWSDHNPEGSPTILLIHSLGTDRGIWDGQVGWLAGSGRRVVTIDLPGHGGSSANPPPYTIETLGTDLMRLVAEVTRSGSYEVMGVSLGGLVALWLAITDPAVTALVAANTAARLGTIAGWSERIAAVEAQGMERVGPAVVPRFFAPTTGPDVFDRYLKVFAATDPIGYVGCCAVLRDTDLGDHVGEIACPTLVVAGDVDIAAPPALSLWLHERIPGSELAVIPGAGHLSNIDQPETFHIVVGRFLSRL